MPSSFSISVNSICSFSSLGSLRCSINPRRSSSTAANTVSPSCSKITSPRRSGRILAFAAMPPSLGCWLTEGSEFTTCFKVNLICFKFTIEPCRSALQRETKWLEIAVNRG